jgi:hypothetical protein
MLRYEPLSLSLIMTVGVIESLLSLFSVQILMAQMPYTGWTNKKVMEQVSAGFRLQKPMGCSDDVYRVMVDCWNKNVKVICE